MIEDLPKKLTHDAIVEANFEVRFNADPSSVPEIFFGRLADNSDWRGFNQRRLPTADIPAALRRADPSLRYQPAIELVHPEGTVKIRVGAQSLSYGRLAPYPGWSVFGKEITSAVEALFAIVPKINISRLGLRYINALRSDLHRIKDIRDLNLEITVDQGRLDQKVNLNYSISIFEGSSCTVRVATTDFARGSIPENTTLVADLDVSTDEPYLTTEIQQVLNWKELAHNAEKQSFFRLLKSDTIKELRVD